ncbi:Alpha/Beta hydrolase protein [Lipomyces oligophaga]|uniref:Alpha/Beta hydrolase protein n=1 Tax=Lipomyces oligophaga TaxID=45792 RepID=UPI0034CE8AD8
MSFETTKKIKSFGGEIHKLTHESKVLKCQMALNLFIPATSKSKLPVLWHLGGLTCNSDTSLDKNLFHYWAAKYEIAMVYPDTSPRDSNHPGEHDAIDIGSSAGFYLNATAEPWSENYHMETYIVDELPKALYAVYDILDGSNVALQGHSMGGHGALTLYLKYPELYKTTTAFAPIANPINGPWGKKAFAGYLKTKEEWPKHDATELIRAYNGPKVDILISIGTDDQFLHKGEAPELNELLIENFVAAAIESGHGDEVTIYELEGYDHMFEYVGTVAERHIQHAAKHLGVY